MACSNNDFWNGESGRVFSLMCPDTARPCHSMCVAWRDVRDADGYYNRAGADVWTRQDGDSNGRCIKYDVRIPAGDVHPPAGCARPSDGDVHPSATKTD